MNNFWTDDGKFHAAFERAGMEASGNNPLKGIRTCNSLDGIEFDITFNFTSPVFINAALDSYLVGGQLGYESSLPKRVTQGWLRFDGERVDIIPEKSLTWYDRQWASLQDSFQ